MQNSELKLKLEFKPRETKPLMVIKSKDYKQQELNQCILDWANLKDSEDSRK